MTKKLPYFQNVRGSFPAKLLVVTSILSLKLFGQPGQIRQSRYPDIQFQDLQHPGGPTHSLQNAQIAGTFTVCVGDFNGIMNLAADSDSIKAKWQALGVTPVFFATSNNPEVVASKLSTLTGILDEPSINSLNVDPPLKTGDVEVIVYYYRLLVARKRIQIKRLPDEVMELNRLETERIAKAGKQATSPTDQNTSIIIADSVDTAVTEASGKGVPVLLVTAARTECTPYSNLKAAFEATVQKNPTLAAWLNLHAVCVLMENSTPLKDGDGRIVPANVQIWNQFDAKYLKPYDIHITTPTCVFLDSSDGTALTSPIPLDFAQGLMRVAQIVDPK